MGSQGCLLSETRSGKWKEALSWRLDEPTSDTVGIQDLCHENCKGLYRLRDALIEQQTMLSQCVGNCSYRQCSAWHLKDILSALFDRGTWLHVLNHSDEFINFVSERVPRRGVS